VTFGGPGCERVVTVVRSSTSITSDGLRHNGPQEAVECSVVATNNMDGPEGRNAEQRLYLLRAGGQSSANRKLAIRPLIVNQLGGGIPPVTITGTGFLAGATAEGFGAAHRGPTGVTSG